VTSRPARVLQLFEARDGGVPEHVRALTAGLEARGQEAVVAGPADAALRPAFDRMRSRYVPLPIVGSMFAPVRDVRTLAGVVALMRSERFDVVHVHGLKPALLGRAVAIARGVPVVYTPNCFVYRSRLERPSLTARFRSRMILALERLLGRRTAALVAVSEEEREAAVKDGVVPGVRARLVNNGVAPDLEAAPDPTLAEFRGAGPLLGLVAGLRDQKGLPTLLDALESLARDGGAPLFAIVGNGLLAGEVRRRVESGPLAATTIVVPFEGRPEPYLAALDVFVLPSYWEGLPIGVLEAMAMGLPVVATAVGGTPEAVENGRTGWVVPPRDPGALAARLREISEDSARAERMGAAGRVTAKERFGVDTMVDRLLAIYREVGLAGARD